jgi:hypothetical protein
MKTAFVLTLGLMMAIVMAFVPLAYQAAGGEPLQISAQQSLKDVKGGVTTPSGADKGLFVPACLLDSTLIDRMSQGNPRTGDQSSRDTPQPVGPAKHYKVGSYECQS